MAEDVTAEPSSSASGPMWDDPADKKPHLRLLTQHLALLSAGIAVVVVAKILLAARGNAETALTIAQHAGVPTVTLGSLVQVYPHLLAGAALYLAFVFDASSSEDERRLARGLFIPVAVLAIPLTTWWGLLYVWIAADFIFPRWPGLTSVRAWWRRRRDQREVAEWARESEALETDVRQLESLLEQLDVSNQSTSLSSPLQSQGETVRRVAELARSIIEGHEKLQDDASQATERANDEFSRLTVARQNTPRRMGALVAILGVMILVHLLTQPPWIPQEEVFFAEGDSVSGYVLASENDDLIFMDSRTRLVERIPVEEISDRRICAPPNATRWSDAPLMELLYDRPSYGPCP